MADPDPIDLALLSSASVVVGQRPDGKLIPAQLSNAGKLLNESADVVPLGMWVTRAVIDVGVEPDGRTQLPDFACSQVRVIAHAANAHPIYIGDATVSSTNVCPTTAKNGEQIDRMSNADEVYVVAAAGHTGQKLYLQTR